MWREDRGPVVGGSIPDDIIGARLGAEADEDGGGGLGHGLLLGEDREE